MFASVIPAVRLPKDVDGRYDYEIPDDLAPHVRRGSWVVVPWRGKPTDALVAEVLRTPSHEGRLKAVAGLGAPDGPDEDVVAMVGSIAERYFCSAGTAAKAFLPKTPKTKVLTAEQAVVREGAVRDDGRTPVRAVIRYADPVWRDERTAAALRPHAESGRGGIVIVPHAADVDRAVATFRDAIDATVIPVHGGLTAARYRGAWLDILTADGPVIAVGTRQAVLAPVRDLGIVVVHEADSPDLKQYDQNPRYDARTIAIERARRVGADALVMSHGPRAEERALVEDEGFAEEAQPLDADAAVLVDVSGAPKDDEAFPISPAVAEAMKTALQGQKRVLLLHNRRGSASAILCRDCGRVLRCPHCEVAFTVHRRTLECHRCGRSTPPPASCPDCNGSELVTLGHGTTTVEARLRALFPDARIARVDADSRDEAGGIPDADIVVGTVVLLHDAAETAADARWGCVATTSIDDLLSHPGFRVSEDAWRTVRTLRDVAASSGATCYLQTPDPDNPRIRALLDDPSTHGARELDERRRAGYPPYGTLIAVTVVADDARSAERTAAALVDRFRTTFRDAPGSSIAGPLAPAVPYRHGKWRRTAVIKTRQVTPELDAALRGLPEDHLIDRDPESIG